MMKSQKNNAAADQKTEEEKKLEQEKQQQEKQRYLNKFFEEKVLNEELAVIIQFFEHRNIEIEIEGDAKNIPRIIIQYLQDLFEFTCTASREQLTHPVSFEHPALDPRYSYNEEVIHNLMRHDYFRAFALSNKHVKQYFNEENANSNVERFKIIRDEIYHRVFNFKSNGSLANEQLADVIRLYPINARPGFPPTKILLDNIQAEDKTFYTRKNLLHYFAKKDLSDLSHLNTLVSIRGIFQGQVSILYDRNANKKNLANFLSQLTIWAVAAQTAALFFFIQHNWKCMPSSIDWKLMLFLIPGYFYNQFCLSNACMNYIIHNPSGLIRNMLSPVFGGTLLSVVTMCFAAVTLPTVINREIALAFVLKEWMLGLTQKFAYFSMFFDNRSLKLKGSFEQRVLIGFLALTQIIYPLFAYATPSFWRVSLFLISGTLDAMNILSASFRNFKKYDVDEKIFTETNLPSRAEKIMNGFGMVSNIIVQVLAVYVVTQEIIPLAVAFFSAIIFSTLSQRINEGFKRYALFSVPQDFKLAEVKVEPAHLSGANPSRARQQACML